MAMVIPMVASAVIEYRTVFENEYRTAVTYEIA